MPTLSSCFWKSSSPRCPKGLSRNFLQPLFPVQDPVTKNMSQNLGWRWLHICRYLPGGESSFLLPVPIARCNGCQVFHLIRAPDHVSQLCPLRLQMQKQARRRYRGDSFELKLGVELSLTPSHDCVWDPVEFLSLTECLSFLPKEPGHGSIGKALASQAWGPEFGSLETMYCGI